MSHIVAVDSQVIANLDKTIINCEKSNEMTR